jgi:phosphoribosylaminoimidazole-succinocarboxamide synthase
MGLKKTKIYEGNSKKLYESERENELIQEFKDDAITKAGEKAGKIKGKGIINNQISAHLFKFLDSYNIPSHFIDQPSSREMVVRRLKMIPIEVVIRNVASGEMAKKFGIEEGKELECPIIEYYLKDEERQDPMINEDHIVAFGHATTEELKEIHRLASKANAILKDFFRRRDLKLVDFTLEFGRYERHIYVGDEISLETCRFVDLRTEKKIDRYILSNDIKAAEEIYSEVKERILGGLM